ncbi:MAG: 1-(5-phosphoribosyl)-5-[(5-phosphoribosylamino)methylideneamino]imidazole-4-carboxamide isomerase [Bacteroidales bacterium]|jgi:phosphoribosylformimino-5-aminoimidazole carboxamide ribotide isomerase|nr:1-(5-phosphoribosyl)-5-[(5-phosphoribosylamino)methylideneamino]imidazole-4-carboxamide isomerase [Bacteroidales bacterium]
MIEVIPAIDIIDGNCVRLTQGDYGQKTVYGDSPLEAAMKYETSGAGWLHLVDLDGAKASEPVNLDVLKVISGKTGLSVEWGGGVKSEASLKKVFDAGASRIVCGSVAVENPGLFSSWLSSFGPDRIVLGADIRDGFVSIHGWSRLASLGVDGLIDMFAGAGLSQVICTDISKDGMLAGPALDLYSRLQDKYPGISFTVSGGVSSVKDVENADAKGLRRIIIGKALYEGRIKTEELKKWWRKE